MISERGDRFVYLPYGWKERKGKERGDWPLSSAAVFLEFLRKKGERL